MTILGNKLQLSRPHSYEGMKTWVRMRRDSVEEVESGVVESKAVSKMWHPDKFLQRFGDRLGEEERVTVMTRVTEVAMAVNALHGVKKR